MMVEVPQGQTRWLAECSVVRWDHGYSFFVLDDDGRPVKTVEVWADGTYGEIELALGQALRAVLAP